VLFYTDPHTPYRPLRKYRKFMEEVGATENIEYPLREYLEPLPKADHEAIVAAYDGEVAYADAQVGRLLDALQELGLAERTIVAVTADHGEMFGERNCCLHSYHMWEWALRVPAVIASPAIPVKGVVDDRPRTHVDLAPTLLELSGLEVPESLSGVSVARTLADPTAGRDRPLFSQYNARGVKRQAARIGRWKLVHHHQVEKGRFFGAMERQRKATDVPRADPSELPSVAFDGARFELYDLVNDTGEVNDLFKDKVDEPIVAELKKLIDHGMGKVEDGAAVPELSKETLEALKAAGYIQ